VDYLCRLGGKAGARYQGKSLLRFCGHFDFTAVFKLKFKYKKWEYGMFLSILWYNSELFVSTQ
jgi:hypothetical protein